MRLVFLCAVLVACGGTSATDDAGPDATTSDVVVMDAPNSNDVTANEAGADVVAEADAGPACDANVSNDPLNCGSCGYACADGGAHTTPSCSGGACGTTCVKPWDDCDKDASTGCETNTNFDTTNCGACGTTCNAPEATSACNQGACVITQCATGYGDCDLQYDSGCEAPLSTSVMNCGNCGHACPYGPNSSAVCYNANCGIVCSQGWADCNNMPTDGCEVNINTSNANCGSCNAPCGLGKTCVNGLCQ